MTASAHHLAAPDPGAVDAVSVLMHQVSEGTLTGTGMADRAAQRCAEVFAVVDGPTDPLWPTHLAICRAVLGFGGLPAAELAQWLAVARQRENPDAATVAPPEQALAVSEPYSPDCGDDETEPNPVATEQDTIDAVDKSDSLADLPREVLAEAERAAWAVIENYRREVGHR